MSGNKVNQSNFQMFQSSGKLFSPKALKIIGTVGTRTSFKSQILLCRIATGRVASNRSSSNLVYHTETVSDNVYRCKGPCLAYPQYIITYKNHLPHDFRYAALVQP